MKLFNMKKRFFQRLVKQNEAEIWDSEYKRFSFLIDREQARLRYDQGAEMLNALKEKKDEPNKAKMLEEAESQVKNLKLSLDNYDRVLAGFPPGVDENYPEGMRGMDEKISDLVGRKEKLIAFIADFC